MTDQYDAWRRALTGKAIDFGPKGEPPSGFFRHLTKRGIEAVAVWRDGDGNLQCKRSIFGDGSKMTPEEIDELVGSCGHYPIPYELYTAVTRDGQLWPHEASTKLTMAEIKDGVGWTLELGRKKLGIQEGAQAADDAADNPRGVVGNNQPLAPSPVEVLSIRVEDISILVKDWLAEIGGAPRDKAEADRLADYASKFAELRSTAETEHKREKAPHLEAGRAVDAAWFPIRDKADALRKRCLEIAAKWMKAEEARRAEEARKANEEAKRRAEESARQTGAPAEPISEVKAEPVKIGHARTVSQRTRVVWRVTDLPAFANYLAKLDTPPPEFVEVCEKLANKLGKAGAKVPGIEKDSERSAA